MPPHKSSNIKPSIEEALNEGVTYDPDIVRLEPGQAFIDKTGAVRPEPASNAYGMDFGDAIRCLKRGQRVRRNGWTDKDAFTFLVAGSRFAVNREPLLSVLGEGAQVDYCAHVDMKAADGRISVWNPDQRDMLADDWRVVA
jgi:hypothetical protein